MTSILKKISFLGKAAITAILIGVVFFSTDVLAAKSATYDSPYLKISGKLPECTYPQKRGGGQCLEALNAKSCINTTPFSPIGGVSSEMCARGNLWCEHNKSGGRYVSTARCPIPPKQAKNHQGYDYQAKCGTSIYAPCDGKLSPGKKNGMKFTCQICGKSIEFTFYHNQRAMPDGDYKRGQKIGEAGNLNGYPCHMHIEIREGGQLLDPMNSGFDAYVCSCQKDKQVNRMNCFNGGNAPVGPVNTGYDESLTTATVVAAQDANSGIFSDGSETVVPENCSYEIVQQKYQEAGCMFCKPFRILFNTASIMAKASYESLAGVVVTLVGIAFAIWLAITIMKFVSSFEIREPRIMIKTLLNQAFRVLVVVLILQAPMNEILSMTIDPVFATGLKIAQLGGGLAGGNPSDCGLASGGDDSSGSSSSGAGKDTPMLVQQLKNSWTNITGSSSDDLSVVADGGLSAEMGNGIICTIKSIQDQIMDIMAIGRVSWCLAWEDATLLGLIPNFAYLITSILFFLAGFMMMFIYPFLLVDSILKMTMSIALFPAALGAYAFKITSQYLKKIWETFLNALFIFIFLSLIIMIVSAIAKQYITEIISDDIRLGILGPIMWYTVGAAKISFVLFLGWSALSEAKPLTDKFAKAGIGGGMNIGSKTGSAAGAAAKNYVVKPAAKLGKKTLQVGGRIASENASHAYRKYKADHYQNEGEAALNEDGSAMLDEDGNQMYKAGSSTVRNAWNQFVNKTKGEGNSRAGRVWNKIADSMQADTKEYYRSYSQDASGNVRENKYTLSSNGTQTVTRSDAYGSVTEKTYADGTTQVTKQKAKTAIRHLTDAKGGMDEAAVNDFMQNSLLSEKDKNRMLITKIFNERMGQYTGGRLDGNYRAQDVDFGVDDNGNRFIKVNQINADGTKSTFEATFHGNRVMTSVETIGGNGKGIAYATDGIIQRKSYIDGNNVTHRYAVADFYAKTTARPVFINGDTASNIDRKNILFSDEDMKRFGEQVRKKGNNAYDLGAFLKR